jgi:hypothetical protein
MKKKTVRVRAGKGITIPLRSGLAIGTTGVTVMTPESDPIEVVLDRFIRNRIKKGDLVAVESREMPLPSRGKKEE